MNKLAERLDEVMRARGVSRRELARRVGMSESVVSNYCTGKREPSIDVLFAICRALGESADYLIGLTDN